MVNKNTIITSVQKNPAIAAITVLALILIIVAVAQGEKPEYFVRDGVISNTDKIQPSAEIGRAEKLLESDKSGIVSFEMYVPQKKEPVKVKLSREQIVDQIAHELAMASDQLKSKNMLINRVSALDFKLSAPEFIKILKASSITDPFYYTNVVKRIAPILSYPIPEQQLQEIVKPVSDLHYRHKLYDELIKEQIRNK